MRTLLALALLACAGPALAQEHDHSAHAAGGAAAPAQAKDNAADAVYDSKAMEAARATLRAEHGDVRYAKWMVETAEYRPGPGPDGYGWEAQASFGGDINRLAFKTEGEGEEGELDEAEVQALWSRAVSPYFNLQAGVRHDLEPGSRSHAVIGIEGLAPYWFEVGAFAFLSEDGDASARLEASYDLRLTQRLILEPRAELNLAEGGAREEEYGLRLRYQVEPHLAPYLGVMHRRERSGPEDTRAVIGLWGFF